MTRDDLIALMNSLIKTGGNQTSAADIRSVLSAFVEGVLNILDDKDIDDGYVGVPPAGFSASKIAAFNASGKLISLDITIDELEAIIGGGGGYDGDPSIIDQDDDYRFVTTAQVNSWDLKEAGGAAAAALLSANGYTDTEIDALDLAITTALTGKETAGAAAAALIAANGYTDSEIATLLSYVNAGLATKEVVGAAAAALVSANTHSDAGITALLDGVVPAGNTLQKLYNLILGSSHEVTVADIAARNAYNVPSLPFNVFVTNDGDGNWALYKATSTGVGAAFVKLSDPDLLNAVMSASQIKIAYESNPDTNAFTNLLLAKLNAIAAGATANSTDAQLRDRTTHTGTQTADTITDGVTNKAYTATEKTKLGGIDTGATANDTDSNLKARGNHTGTQLAVTISDFNAAALAAAPAETTATQGTLINSAATKPTPIDADFIGLMDSAASNILKKLSWANLKATLKTYFDSIYPALTTYNHSVTGQGPGFAVDTYLTGSDIVIPGTIKIGSRYHVVFDATKTGAGIATPIINVRVGAAGTVADTSRAVLTFLAQTGAIDDATFEMWITFRAVGPACIMQVTSQCVHGLAATGFQNQPAKVVRSTTGAFVLTTGHKIGISVNGGASAAWTVQQVQAELSNT